MQNIYLAFEKQKSTLHRIYKKKNSYSFKFNSLWSKHYSFSVKAIKSLS